MLSNSANYDNNFCWRRYVACMGLRATSADFVSRCATSGYVGMTTILHMRRGSGCGRRAHRDLAIFALTPPGQTESKIEISLRYITSPASRSAFAWLSLSLHEDASPLSARQYAGSSFF